MSSKGIGFCVLRKQVFIYKENKMNKFVAILCTLLTAYSASGCAEHSVYNSPDQQREHAEKGQGEMSSGMKNKY
jgi:hypothetical protein